MPVISGGNRDEARAYVGGAMLAGVPPITAKSYPAMLRTTFGADADRVAARYPLSRYASPPLAWSTLTTDASWACQTATADRYLAAHTTVYPYEFADPDAPNVNGFDIPGPPMGAARTGDPNDAGAPQWAAGTVRGTSQMQFVPDRTRQVNVAAQHQCPFWATVR